MVSDTGFTGKLLHHPFLCSGCLVNNLQISIVYSKEPRFLGQLGWLCFRTQVSWNWPGLCIGFRFTSSVSFFLLNKDVVFSGLPWWLSRKESAHNAGAWGLNPGSGRSPGEGHGNLLQYSCLGNPVDRGAWWATVCGDAKSQTWLKWLSTHARSWFSHGQWNQKYRRPSRTMEAHSRPLCFSLLTSKSSNKLHATSLGRKRACYTSQGGRSWVISEQRCQCIILQWRGSVDLETVNFKKLKENLK